MPHKSIVISLLALFAAVLSVVADEVKPRGSVRVFLDEGCPIARYHTLTLRQFHREFSKLGIRFEAYFPNISASKASVEAFAKKFEIPFPVQVDAQQVLARAVKATIVPEVFVYDRHQKLVYRGRIDDTYVEIGKKRPAARQHDLKDTLQALVDGKTISVGKTTPVGCLITFATSTNERQEP